MAWIAALGFLMTLGSVIGLTRYAEPQEREEPEEAPTIPAAAQVGSHRANGAHPTANGAHPTANGADATANGAHPTANGAHATANGAHPATAGNGRSVLNGHTPAIDFPTREHPALSEQTAELPILPLIRPVRASRS
jgi:hypothetical protein